MPEREKRRRSIGAPRPGTGRNSQAGQRQLLTSLVSWRGKPPVLTVMRFRFVRISSIDLQQQQFTHKLRRPRSSSRGLDTWSRPRYEFLYKSRETQTEGVEFSGHVTSGSRSSQSQRRSVLVGTRDVSSLPTKPPKDESY